MAEDDYYPESATVLTLSRSASAGLAGLLIGCTLLVSACVLMVFNIALYSHGLRGIPVGLAQLGAVIGLAGVAAIGVLGTVFGIISWTAARDGEPKVLGIAATLMSVTGLIAWLIAAINLMIILLS